MSIYGLFLYFVQRHGVPASYASCAWQRLCARIDFFVCEMVIVSQIIVVGTFESAYLLYSFHSLFY